MVTPYDPTQAAVPQEQSRLPSLNPGFLQALSGFASGNNVGEQFGNVNALLANQNEQQKLEEVKNKTLSILEGQSPEIAAALKAGAMTPQQAMSAAMQQRQAAADAAKPKYQLQNIDGRLVRVDVNSGQTDELGNYSKPKLPAIAEEYNWAKENGFDGTAQEYQAWKANIGKQKGMIIESDGNGGFRMTQGDVDTTKMPKLTEAEGKNAGFLLRAKQANEILTSGDDPATALETEGTSERNRIAANTPVVGNYVRSNKGRQYQQAKDNFITAILRKESGAVIAETEYAREDQKYFPQPNDDAVTIEQKRRAREAAIEGLRLSSGPAADRIDNGGNDDPMGLR